MRARRRLLAVVLPLTLIALLLPACGLFRELGLGGDRPQWVERRYRGVGAATALQLAQNVLQPRYQAQEVDLYRGMLKSGWVYGRYTDVTHQAVRSRVIVETEPEDDRIVVRIRVQQETSQSAGRYVTHDPGDWEPFDDDPAEANRLMTKLNVILGEVGERVPEPDATESP